jgi:hypothetical protein
VLKLVYLPLDIGIVHVIEALLFGIRELTPKLTSLAHGISVREAFISLELRDSFI